MPDSLPSKEANRTDIGPRRVMIVGAVPRSLVVFRGHLVETLVSRGHSVVAVASGSDAATQKAMGELGAFYRSVTMQRTGLNPISDMKTVRALHSLMRSERPDIVLAYTAKPVIYGGLAARSSGVPAFYALITGLGTPFTEPSTLRRTFIRRSLEALYRVSLASAERVFFQNHDDLALFKSKRILYRTAKHLVVAGSGVDLEHYRFSLPPKTGILRFLLMGRLIREKGVEVFVEAAKILRRLGREVQFALLGRYEKKSSAIDGGTIRKWVDEGLVDYLGEQADVRPYLEGCHVFVLPSYYREGVPRSILEAMSIGRAIITTDAPGCRETVRHGHNGYLVPSRDPKALAEAMDKFITDPDLAITMGERSRQLAQRRFDVEHVTADLLRGMEL